MFSLFCPLHHTLSEGMKAEGKYWKQNVTDFPVSQCCSNVILKWPSHHFLPLSSSSSLFVVYTSHDSHLILPFLWTLLTVPPPLSLPPPHTHPTPHTDTHIYRIYMSLLHKFLSHLHFIIVLPLHVFVYYHRYSLAFCVFSLTFTHSR